MRAAKVRGQYSVKNPTSWRAHSCTRLSVVWMVEPTPTTVSREILRLPTKVNAFVIVLLFGSQCVVLTGEPTETNVNEGSSLLRTLVTDDWAPVCGVDGHTYTNACAAGRVETTRVNVDVPVPTSGNQFVVLMVRPTATNAMPVPPKSRTMANVSDLS